VLKNRHLHLCSIFSASVLLAAYCPAQQTTLVRVDASQAWQAPQPAAYDAGASLAPNGDRLSIDSRELLLNGQPLLPAMGEFHYSRFPRAQWEPELLKMKSVGITGVSTYAFWIHHEEIEGQWDWADQRDLRAFAALCKKHGMWMVLRVGPWAHGEARNGGLPDWLLQQGPVRQNSPGYLQHVQLWFAQIDQQVKGLLWKDGGPIIGVQLENEYSKRGPGAGEEHILTLRRMVQEAGLDVPFYFVTAWDNAVLPPRAVLPIYGGGYPDAPWDRSILKLAPGEGYAFHLQNRVTANMGAMGAPGQAANANDQQPAELPFVTIEIGGGNQVTYHRRPVISGDDIGAMFPVMLGSGVNLYGTYMFQGGQNPEGKLTTLQESQGTGYPNDLPIKSYDFEAPLSQFGEERASLRKMKLYQCFLQSFGAQLAPMQVHAAEQLPANTSDLVTPRVTVRSRGNAGFVFFNNYVRNYTMPARPALQFEVALPSGTLHLPAQPIDIPAASYFIWPFNLRAGSATLHYATAQLITRTESHSVTTYYLASLPGVRTELAFDATTVRSVNTSAGAVQRANGLIAATIIQPGLDAVVSVTAKDGTRTRWIVLSAAQAENAWKIHIAGHDHLLITASDVYAAPDVVHLLTRADAHFSFDLLPAPSGQLTGSAAITCVSPNRNAAHCTATVPAQAPQAIVNLVHPAQLVPPAKMSAAHRDPVALAPAEGELPQAARWSIEIPKGAGAGLSELFLDIRYTGDLARLYDNGHLLTDDFWTGNDWSVGLNRFLADGQAHSLTLDVLPLRNHAPIYFELPAPVAFPSNGQAAELQSIKLTPQYELILSTGKQ